AEALAVERERLLRPGHVLLDGFLHLFGTEFREAGRVVVEQQHELRHGIVPPSPERRTRRRRIDIARMSFAGRHLDCDYSYRSASIGSTRDARWAGMNPAASATMASATVAAARTIGS